MTKKVMYECQHCLKIFKDYKEDEDYWAVCPRCKIANAVPEK